MAIRTAKAKWEGATVQGGKGTMTLGSGAFSGPYSFQSRFEDGAGTNPEELIGAAHAGCYSMALTGTLAKSGMTVEWIATEAKVHLMKLEAGFTITSIELHTEAKVPGADAKRFGELAELAKLACPVSRALGGVKIELFAKLV
ncbi:MAG: OsmC family protein [Vicinamibacteria bacterium]|nr:OsmC family protein [Vicinamibacteria bacterium]